MKTICEPFLQLLPSTSKRTLIINSILYERLIMTYGNGYFFYYNYSKLAEDSASIIVDKEDKKVSDGIDHMLDLGFENAAKRKLKPIDLMAAHQAIGGFTDGGLLARTIGEKNPIIILKKLREFYEQKKIRTFKLSFSRDDYQIMRTIDDRMGQPYLKLFDFEFSGKDNMGIVDEELASSAHCVSDLMWSRLYSSIGYAYFPSHNASILRGYSRTFLKIEEELRKNARVSDAFKSSSVEESLKYLLGDKSDGLNQLLGFTPLNPLGLLSNEVTDEQVDEAVLKIRKSCKKIRTLIEKVHTSCLEYEIQKAINAKMRLEDGEANQSINYSILENTSEYLDGKLRDAIHTLIDNEFKTDSNSDIVKIHRRLGKLRSKLRWISEARFLTFGTILVLASQGIGASYLQSVFDGLGKISLGLGASDVALRILKEGMKLYPGFSIYASFVDWPKVV